MRWLKRKKKKIEQVVDVKKLQKKQLRKLLFLKNTWWITAIIGFVILQTGILAPYLAQAIQILMLFWVLIIQFGGMFILFSRMQIERIYPEELDYTWDNWRGNPEKKKELMQIAELLKENIKYQEFGGNLIRGIMFYGKPGTGKTYSAKIIASVCGVPVLIAKGGAYVPFFMGVDILKIWMNGRWCRKMSRKYGGCVWFIDEIDSIGQKRAGLQQQQYSDKIFMGMGGGFGLGLNQLLSEIDGVETPSAFRRFLWRTFKIGNVSLFTKPKTPNYNIVFIGATNKKLEIFDPALMSRLSNKIFFPEPGRAEREDLYKYYLTEHNYTEQRKGFPLYRVNTKTFQRMSELSTHTSPRDIVNICKTAMRLALRDGETAISRKYLEKALFEQRLGAGLKREFTPEVAEKIARHESGHAVATHYLLPKHDILAIDLEAESAYGQVSHIPKEEYPLLTYEDWKGRVMVSLAGRSAEELFYEDKTAGASADFRNVSAWVHIGIQQYGFGSSVYSPPSYSDGYREQFIMSQDLMAQYEKEAMHYINIFKKETDVFVKSKKDLIDLIAQKLLKKRRMTGLEVIKLIEEWEENEGKNN